MMKFTRFEVNAVVHTGILEKEVIRKIEGNIYSDWAYTGEVFSINDVKLLAPLEPNQIIGIGANYVAKVEELPNELPDIPVFFFKPTSSVIGPEEKIVIPDGCDEIKFESELAVVIGKEAKNLQESEIYDYVFGYTVTNDVTAPQFFIENGQWTVGKSFDTFTPLGPIIETELDPSKIKVVARVDGKETQNSGTELMIFSIEKMISYLSKVMTLKPGDVILTGSPVGAEFVGAETVVECEIAEIGVLKNQFTK